ncbi:MAG: 30S ribosomal protein S16 [Candidatus Kuenenbacteria bacterium]
MVMIRLSRTGKKKKAQYRIVVQDKQRDPWGKFLEILGSYNPHNKELNVEKDRVEYWISVGAQMSVTVNNLFISNDVVKGEKIKAHKSNKKKKGEPASPAKPASPAILDKKKEEIKEKNPAEDKADGKKEEAKGVKQSDGKKEESASSASLDKKKEEEKKE